MPTYPIACVNCGDQETFATMSHARANDLLECPVCQRARPRRIVLFQHTEDRTHMWRGPNGDRYSFALGAEMPDSRSERDRLARERGVEFIGLKEHLAENKEAAEAVEYRKYINEGGARDERPAPSDAPFVPTPEWAKPLIGA